MNGRFLRDEAVRNKEKETQEMATLLCKRNVACNTCDCRKGYCPFLEYGHTLYNAGYRNADTVRKETAEHILGALYDITFERKWDEVNGDLDEQNEVVSRAALKNMAKDYGVELPE